jgi:hypothetical protein
MRSTLKRLALPVLVGSCVATWSLRTDHDVIAAQHRTEIGVTRLFTGPDGQTHAETTNVKLMPDGDVGAMRSELIRVSGLRFGLNPGSYSHDWHPAPRRQYVITLSGREEIEIAGGKKIMVGPGHILLAEDVTGKGHISRGVGTEDRVSLYIPIDEK